MSYDGPYSMDDEALVREVDELGEGLSRWEVDFVADLVERIYDWGERFRLTGAQRMKLEEIHELRVH